MKHSKSHISNKSRPGFRSRGASPKTREGEDARPAKRFYNAPAFGKDETSDRRDKKSFGGKRGFAGKSRPGFRARDEQSSFESKPRFAGKHKRDFHARDEQSSFDTKPRFPGKRKPDFRARDDNQPREERPDFRGKPAFADKRFGKPKPAFQKPAFQKPRPETKPGAYKPEGDSVLIWGLHAARAAFLNPHRRVTRLWLSEAGQKLFEQVQNDARDELLKRPDPKKTEREELDRITPPNSVHQGIVIEVSPLPERSLHDVISADPPPDLLLMLDQVTDPHNVGAILRSAAAFGAGAVVMTERNAPATTGVLAKSASGALEHVPMVHVVNLARALDELHEAGYWCIGLAEEGEKNLGELDLSGRTVLVLGAEGEGLRHLTRQKCDELARLPTQGPIESLNVSNAAAVALYEVRRQAK